MRPFFLRLAVAACVVFPSLSRAQSPEDFLRDIPEAKMVLLDRSFKSQFSPPPPEFVGLMHMPPRVDEIVLLTKDWVHEELGLTPHEIKQYADEYKTLERKRIPLREDLLDSLSAKQKTRFREIQVRCRIRTFGILKFFSLPQLELSNEELLAIEKLMADLEPAYAQKAAELRDKTLEDILSLLTEAQREKMKVMSQGFLESRLPPLELLVWQLKYFDYYRETIADRLYFDHRGRFMGPQYRVDFDGCLQHHQLFDATDGFSELTEEEKQKFENEHLDRSFVGSIFSMMMDPATVEELQTTADQEAIATQFRKESAEFWVYWPMRLQSESDTATRETSPVYAEYRKALKELYSDKGRKIIDEILLPHQRTLIITMSALRECFMAGIPGAIAFGQTGQMLDVTAAVKKEVENLCSESLSEIEAQTRKWEKEIFEQVKQCLHEDSRRRLSHLFDFESDAGAVNIHLLLKGGYR